MEIVVALIVGLVAGWFGATFIVAKKYSTGADADELRKLQVQLAERNTALEERTSQRDEVQQYLAEVSDKLSTTTQELAKVRAEDQTRREEMKRTQEQLERERKEMREQLDTHFKGIASQVVQTTSEEFRKQAQEDFKRQRELSDKDLESRQIAVDNLVKPVGETLEKIAKARRRNRKSSRGGLRPGAGCR